MVNPKFLTQRAAAAIMLNEEPFAKSKIPAYADGMLVGAETEDE
jgi:hypothetical protein